MDVLFYSISHLIRTLNMWISFTFSWPNISGCYYWPINAVLFYGCCATISLDKKRLISHYLRTKYNLYGRLADRLLWVGLSHSNVTILPQLLIKPCAFSNKHNLKNLMTTVVGRARAVVMVVSAHYCELYLLGGMKYTPTTGGGGGSGGKFWKITDLKNSRINSNQL